MNTKLKNKKLSILLFCALTVLVFFGCQTIDETIVQTSQTTFNDYGARNYDAARFRFSTPDPVAETHYTISPYAYVLDKPVYIDSLTVIEVESLIKK